MTVSSVPGSLDEILQRDGADFVRACYREILQRDPDESGLAHHVAALSQGVPKALVITSIASSDEACLTGRALSPLAVKARNAAYLETRSGWMLWPPVVRYYRARQEAALRKRTAEIQRLARIAEAKSASETLPKPPPVEVTRIAPAKWEAAVRGNRSTDAPPPSLWFDLTTAFQWTQGVVGIVRAELEIACGLKKIHPSVRFSMQVDQGFAEIDQDEIGWLLDAENVVDAYMTFFGRYAGAEDTARTVKVDAPDREGFFHPYQPKDTVLSVGWMDSQKEKYFTLLKDPEPQVYLVYLVYDMILLLDDTRHFYSPIGRQQFKNYIKWITHHCDLVLFGGRTAQSDTEAYQQQQGWPTPPGSPVKFGTDIVKVPKGAVDQAALLERLGVTGDFVMTVGSIEPRKNHETLYRAYLMALEEAGDDAPQLVIVGKPMWRADDLMNIITRHPKLEGRVLCLRPTDLELAALYENCLFTLLPSLYEGWSLTLPESLGQGKFCLCSDTPPLREIGGDLVDYVAPFDVKGWADKIVLYASDKALLAEKNRRVAKEWPAFSWTDTATMALDAIKGHIATAPPAPIRADDYFARREWTAPTIWMDLTLSYLQWQGGISGIVRAELELARNLKALRPDTRFFAYQSSGKYFFEIDSEQLLWLFKGKELSHAYQSFHDFWQVHEGQGSGYRDPFRTTGQPTIGHSACLTQFPPNSIAFFAGIDMDGTGELHRSKEVARLVADDQAVMTSQLIYDLTPFVCPQFHLAGTSLGFAPFFEQVSNNFDYIVYGGKTAQRDGIDVQRQHGWKSPPSGAIKFGSDIVTPAKAGRASRDKEDQEILANLGIDGDFIMTVGTIEPRKNHEVLYKAYLTLLQNDRLARPVQMVFAGKQGWNSDDFLAIVKDDERVRGRLLIMSPTDKELDVLYRKCLFTLLPSFYEGWSLTLPESLSYGKLCLASDVDPLREIGGDLADYIHPLDTYAWADRIAYYANEPARLAPREERIRKGWGPTSWRESTEDLVQGLHQAHKSAYQHLFARVG